VQQRADRQPRLHGTGRQGWNGAV